MDKVVENILSRLEGHPLHQLLVQTYGPPCSQVEFLEPLPVCFNVFGLTVMPWPRWISARPEPQLLVSVQN